jgi:hypothetical protein
MRNMLMKTIIGLTFLGFNISTHAELPFNSIYVFTEEKSKDDEDCDVDPSRLVDTAKSTLRYNRLNIIHNSDADADVDLYISTNTMAVTENYCVFNVRVEFYKYGPIDFPKKRIMGEHMACSKSFIGGFKKNNMQRNMNDSVRELTEFCLSKIEKK